MARTVNCFAAWCQINIKLFTNKQLCQPLSLLCYSLATLKKCLMI